MSKIYDKLKTWKPVAKYINDYEFRTVTNAAAASFTTSVIGAYNLAIAILAETAATVWFATLAGYYFSLAVARIAVILSHRAGLKKSECALARKKRDAANYLGGGALIIVLTLLFTGIILLTAIKKFHFEYPGLSVYLMSFYAFWKIIAATVNAVKVKKFDDLTVQTLRNYSVADGIVSIVALQTALLSAFSADGEELFSYYINLAVGGVAGIILLVMGAYMIARASRRLVRGFPAEEE